MFGLLPPSDLAPSPRPQISVGVPVFNGAALLATALDAILAQDFSDFEVIISDNASTDGTAEIARTYVATDNRIRYFRQPANCGALANFAFVLNEAVGEFFVWAAVDETRSNDFLRVNHDFLVSNPEYVASISTTAFEDMPADPILNGDGLLGDYELGARLVSFLSAWHANSGFYSLFRRRQLLEAISPIYSYLGADWAIMLRVAAAGPLARIEQGWLKRGSSGLSKNHDYVFGSTRVRHVNWLLPFYDMSLVALQCARSKKVSPKAKAHIIRLLVRLNYAAFRAQLTAVNGKCRTERASRSRARLNVQ